MNKVVVTGGFDDLQSHDVRFFEEAAKFGQVHILLWSDQTTKILGGKTPKFSQDERTYFLQAIRYVNQVTVVDMNNPDSLSGFESLKPQSWVVYEAHHNAQKQAFCTKNDITYRVLADNDLQGFPELPVEPNRANKKVMVTGCFDWLHTGHVRFFEETSELGDLYVVVGHDKNIELLKGEGHPLFKQDKRRYMVQAIRYVTQALVSTGDGWMDAEPEVEKYKPDIYAVNEDGDRPEKREFCDQHGLEYVILKRTPKEGLPKRESTQLRGF